MSEAFDEMYGSSAAIWDDVHQIFDQDFRIDVPDAADKYRFIYDPLKGPMKWRNSTVPYMTEPMKCATSREFKAVAFAGGAQTGKTECLINLAMHAAIIQPRDMMLVEKTKESARDFSIRRIDRSIKSSPSWQAQKTAQKDDDNALRKVWRNGAILSLSWPAISELSGRPVPLVTMTDYDRMDQNIKGEGAPFDLGRKRTTTFGSSAMTYVESSPGFEVFDHSWRPKTPHEAPPCEGIFAIYNRGDRRIWYWKCPACDDWFVPWFSCFKWPEEGDPLDRAEAARLHCPHCGYGVSQSERADLNNNGLWVPDNCKIENDELVGEPRRSDIASFWLPGPAASFQGWTEMVSKYILAMEEFEATGSEQALKATVNTDHCEAFLSMHAQAKRTASDLEERATDHEKKKVPAGVRFLVASIDVQNNRFEVQVTGYGERMEKWIIDRYALRWSPSRKDEDGNPEPMDPASFEEDWKALLPVIQSKYALESDSSKAMSVRLTMCDSGGSKAKQGTGSVTEKSYRFWRSCKREGLGTKFLLLKGQGKSQAQQTIRKTLPDRQTGARSNEARGDVPVYLVNVDAVKDIVSNDLERNQPGPGYYNFPDWLPTSYYEELSVETRDPKDGWQNLTRKRNEAFDLCAYAHVAATLCKAERIDWNKPPGWAKAHDENTSIVELEQGESVSTPKAPKVVTTRGRGRRQRSAGQR